MSAAVMSPCLGPMGGSAFSNAEDTIMEPLVFDQSMKTKDLNDDADLESVPELATEEAPADVEMADESYATPNPAFGGLNNLGNTCYMGSALQMLASLDRFVPTLAASIPPQPDDDTPNASKQDLRQAFLDLIQSLRQEGTSMNPSAFKQAMDARSSLFVGYRQQDSHEFLTTLLDLLDEDYHAKSADAAPTEKSTDFDENDEMEESSEGKLPAESFDQVDEEPIGEHPQSPLRRLRSFTQLGNDDISQLLHGNQKTRQDDALAADAPKQPLCKLVGGRAVAPMAPLTPFSVSSESANDSFAKMPQEMETQEEEIQQGDEKEASPVDESFAMQVRARLTCDSCKYTRSHVERYLHLSLDIGSDSGSVEDGLRKFFAPANRQIKCEKCFCETATQTMEIVKLPRALLVHFKRFIVDVTPDYTSIVYRKNQSPVHFSNSLSVGDGDVLGEFLASDVDIPECRIERQLDDEDFSMVDEQPEYRIRSVVNHIGTSASCGHYTADATRLCSNGERAWIRFNDSFVSSVTGPEAMGESARRTAYMVLYEIE